MPHLEAKVVVLGSQGVGKTSVVVRFTRNCFTKTLSPTIGASFFTCSLRVCDRTVKMQVWDTAGQERFRAMAPMYYRKANAALLVYDISSHESFEDIKSWVKELQQRTDGKIGVDVVFHHIGECLVKHFNEDITEFSNDHFSMKSDEGSPAAVPLSGSVPSLAQRTWKKPCC